MSIDTHPSATVSCRRPRRRPFALGALFLACGVSLGMLASLTAIGIAALLVRDASAATEPRSTMREVTRRDRCLGGARSFADDEETKLAVRHRRAKKQAEPSLLAELLN